MLKLVDNEKFQRLEQDLKKQHQGISLAHAEIVVLKERNLKLSNKINEVEEKCSKPKLSRKVSQIDENSISQKSPEPKK